MIGSGANFRGAGFPAAPQPHGLLLSDGFTSKKTAARWAAVEQHLSLGAMVWGVLVFLMSWRYLYHFTEATGHILGAVLVLSGGAGYLGGRRKSANIVNLQLVASLMGILLAFNLISEVVRDTQVDCALAELYHRGKATERSVASVAQHGAMQAVFGRLNELEDQLSMVQQGAAKHLELRHEQEKLRLTDLNYIRAKVDMVKKHAEELLQSVLQNPNVTVDNINLLTEEEKAVLRSRMELADKVLDRIQKHHADKQEEISFEEYQELLAALTDVSKVPADKAASTELQQAKQELLHFKAASERSKADAYSSLLVGDAPFALQRMEAARRQQRERFNEEFEKQLQSQQAQGADFLVDLPEHCVKETAGERIMVGSALLSIVVQLAAAYVALSLSFRLPVKGE